MIEVFDHPQGSDAWHEVRRGIPTASEFHKLLMRGVKRGEESKTRRRYMLELISERITGQPRETYSNTHMKRGQEMEAEAGDLYAFLEDVDLQRVGFVRNGQVGCSPDFLVGDVGMVQIKTMLAPLLLDLHLAGDTNDHVCQQQGELWVAEREWSELFVYWPGIKPFRKKVYRDDKQIKSIELGVEMFLNELNELMATLKVAA